MSRSHSRSFSRTGSRSPSPKKSRIRSGSRDFKISPAPKRARAPREGDNPCRIWVGGLDDRCNDEDLQTVFKKFGELVEIKIRSTSRDTFAFVEFKNAEDASAAMSDLDQSTIRGNRVKVNWAQFKTSAREDRGGRGGNFKPRFQIWVGRLNDQTTESTIRKTFEEFGDVMSLQLRSTSRDVFCFVEFDNSISCEKAIEAWNDQPLEGSTLRVDWSQANSGGKGGGDNNKKRREYERSDRRSPPRRSRYDDRDRDRDRGYSRDRDRGYSRDRDRGYGRDRDRGGYGDRDRGYDRGGGERFRVSRSRSRHGDRGRDDFRRSRREIPKGNYKIQIENLPSEMTWMDLKTLGRKYGGSDSVTFARTWKNDGIPMGIVELRTKDSMAEVIDALDGHRINGSKVRVREIEDDRR